jgi:nitric oxide reductase NorQ protein
LLNYAGTLIASGVDVKDACNMALVCPITDDAEIRTTMSGAIDAVFG